MFQEVLEHPFHSMITTSFHTQALFVSLMAVYLYTHLKIEENEIKKKMQVSFEVHTPK